jgi:6-pyruvoyltetrahydropterin/6-carboxytetrahydropterin synthase
MYELSRQFRFEAAHTLRRAVAAEAPASGRIHGHSYRAEVFIRGEPSVAFGMMMDLAVFEAALSRIAAALDHQFLDDVEDLGPATLENLAAFIWRRGVSDLPGLYCVRVHRDSTAEACAFFGP